MVFKSLNFSHSLGHLKRDKRLAEVIKKHGVIKEPHRPSRCPFESLVQSIVYQQLSGKAAKTIFQRFLKLFKKGRFPKPDEVLKVPSIKLRSAGLSNQKTSYILDLARKFSNGEIAHDQFHVMSDEEIIEHITKVKGIGVWTAQMFLMFSLNRPDVLPTGDLGIQKGFKKLFGLKQLPSPKRMEKLAENWRGHRTVASLYLWKIVDGE